MRIVFRLFVFIVFIAMTAGGPCAFAQEATPATTDTIINCDGAAALDLPAVTLTSDELTAAGLEGFGISSAGPYSVEDDVAYLAESLRQDADEIQAILVDAGYRGSYFSTQSLPSVAVFRASPPSHDVQIGVFPFADAEGAVAGYQLLTDESGVPEAEDVDGATAYGDASELTRSSGDEDPGTGQPFHELELEFRRDCLVVSVSLFAYGADAAEPEVRVIERLGELLVASVDDVLAGRTPGLDALALDLQTGADLLSRSFVFYTMLDGEAVREWNETDEEFADRRDTWRQLGFVNALRSDTPIPAGEETLDDDLRHVNTLIQFPDEATASAYMQGVDDRFAGNPNYVAVTEIEAAPALGDESMSLALTREMDGAHWTLNELFVRVGDVVTVSWIERPEAGPDGPEVGVEPLAELAAAQVSCILAGGDCPSGPVPTGLPGLDETSGATPSPSPDKTISRINLSSLAQ